MPYRHGVQASSITERPAIKLAHLAEDLVIDRQRARRPVALSSLAFYRTRFLPLQMLPSLAWAHA
jgi:hypothetical protein